ncbi:exodeoxyribonuclease III [Candidatus Izemoplasma sp. B36]|uniref:exodeoxyribonuclease III n=1 Tax=Candidatus Izemoplasma sp. B36 TaxID=3242468 RepID=UPI003558AE4A
MKLVTWNVNGLRAATKKGFLDFFNEIDADIFAIQETKMQEEQKEFELDNYYEYWNCADRKGYSGTLIYTKHKPLNVVYGIDGDLYNDEGRIITLEFDNFYFINVYVPNSKPELARIEYRQLYEDNFRDYIKRLDKEKPVVLCGDLNVAHKEIDLKNPKANLRNPGFSIEERTKFQDLLDAGFIDTYRYLNPDKVKYTWWSYRFNARKNNSGWRIDYFVVSDRIKELVENVELRNDIYGSDHCPVEIDIKL